MSIRRICNHFNYMDSAYSTLYEAEVEFEKRPDINTKKKLDSAISDFSKKVYNYKKTVKEIYFLDKKN